MFYSAYQWNAYWSGQYQIARTVAQPVIRNFDYNDYVWARVSRKKRKEEVERVIEQVSLRQSKSLLTDNQKIYDELARELELKGLEFESVYLEALNLRREQLISEEIGKLLKKRIQEEDEAILMLIALSI